MFVVRYDLSDMPPNCQTFARQRIFYMPSDVELNEECDKELRYLMHLRSVRDLPMHAVASAVKIFALHIVWQGAICRNQSRDNVLLLLIARNGKYVHVLNLDLIYITCES